MNNHPPHIVFVLEALLDANCDLKERLIKQLKENAICNPNLQTNPVQSLEQLFKWLCRFLTVMPWEGLQELAIEQSVFRRIDQSTGYFYFIFQHLQDNTELNRWMQTFNRVWGEELNKESSWTEHYYNLIKTDPLFELSTGKYESQENWHCWNDFFSRKLSADYVLPTDFFVADGIRYPWYEVKGNSLNIKTATINNVADLLGESPYKKYFHECRFTHISLDFCNYHHFHSPCDGKIVDIQLIQGCNSGGGIIVWDSEEKRYRYQQTENIGFQMLETRLAIVIQPQNNKSVNNTLNPSPSISDTTSSVSYNDSLTALVAVGVAQVEAFRLADETYVGAEITKNQDLGCFLCGGSDVVILEKSCNFSAK